MKREHLLQALQGDEADIADYCMSRIINKYRLKVSMGLADAVDEDAAASLATHWFIRLTKLQENYHANAERLQELPEQGS